MTVRAWGGDLGASFWTRLVGSTAGRGPQRRTRQNRASACEVLEVHILPTVAFTVAFDDPGNTQTAYYADLEQVVLAAGAQWAQYLDGTATSEVVIGFANSRPELERGISFGWNKIGLGRR